MKQQHQCLPNQDVVVFDCDGVLLDCDGGFAKVASDVLARPMTKLCPSYDLRQRYGITQADADYVFEQMKTHPHGWRGFDPLPGAVQAFSRMRAHGYRIEIVTAIKPDLADLRMESLAAHNMIPDGLHCVGSHTASKAEAVAQINPIMIVDDRLRHLHECPGVPYRVLVDHGDWQDGLEVDEEVACVSSLEKWVSSWELAHGLRRGGLRAVASSPRRMKA